MKRSLLVLALLLGCNEQLASDDGIGEGTQPSCRVASECQTEFMRYQSCQQAACDGQYRSCYGPDYARSIYNGGPCSSWQTCVDRCNCDTACQTSCGQAPVTCLDCIVGTLEPCTTAAACDPLQCTVDAGTGSVGACERLARCCSSLADQALRAQCTTLYTNLAPAGDEICQGVIPAFCP